MTIVDIEKRVDELCRQFCPSRCRPTPSRAMWSPSIRSFTVNRANYFSIRSVAFVSSCTGSFISCLLDFLPRRLVDRRLVVDIDVGRRHRVTRCWWHLFRWCLNCLLWKIWSSQASARLEQDDVIGSIRMLELDGHPAARRIASTCF